MAQEVAEQVQPRARTRATSVLGVVAALALIAFVVAVIAVQAAGVLSPARPLLEPDWPDYGLRHPPPAVDDD